jgi:hypothetical protein
MPFRKYRKPVISSNFNFRSKFPCSVHKDSLKLGLKNERPYWYREAYVSMTHAARVDTRIQNTNGVDAIVPYGTANLTTRA